MTPAASKSTALERGDSNGSDAKSAVSTPDAATAAQHKGARRSGAKIKAKLKETVRDLASRARESGSNM